jgi:predicted DNA-binding WGR domain protein
MPLYELDEGGHRKFYRIELDGLRLVLTWGRIGSAGQRKVIDYETAAEAKRGLEEHCWQRREHGYSVVADESKPRDPEAEREKENAAKLSAGAPLGKAPRFRFVHPKQRRFVWLEVQGSSLVRAEGKLGEEAKAVPTKQSLATERDAARARDKATADLLASGYHLDAFGKR